MIQFQSETLDQAWDDLIPLIHSYWKEAEGHRHYQGFDISRARYAEYESAGMLHCVTVRDDGVLIGYALGYISESMRSQVRIWGDDMFYLHPAYRGQSIGKALMWFIEDYCQSNGISEIVLNALTGAGVPEMLEHVDYTPVSVQYSKRLSRADSAFHSSAVTESTHDGKALSA